ncbi:hypothetical protein JCM8547_000130 [Rhodosporidiobolus lusitaniae]
MAESIASFLSSLALPRPAAPTPSEPAAQVPSSIARLVHSSERLVAVLDDVPELLPASHDGTQPALRRTKTGKSGLALVVHVNEEDEASGEEKEGAVLVYRAAAGPAGHLGLETVFALEEGFGVEVKQTEAGKFAVSFSSPSTSSAEDDARQSFAFLSDSPFSPALSDFLAAVKRLQAKGGKAGGKEGGWAWAKTYGAGGAGGEAGESKGGAGGTRRFGSQFEGSLGAAYGARRTSTRPPLASLDWSFPSPSHPPPNSSLPGSFSQLSPNAPTSPIAERHPERESLYSKETHAAMERWLVQRMREREEEFLEKGEVRVWCGTFNVNDKQPKNGAKDIQSWVDSAGDAEVLVFGFQELDLTAEAMLRYTLYREEAWRKAIEEALSNREGGNRYEKLHSRQLVGALILVYVRSDVRNEVSEVSSASLATGLMGLVANKGVVGVRLRYKDTPLTFLNSHLAAFTSNVAQRNAQVRDTASMLFFPLSEEGKKERDPWTPNLRPDAVRPVGAGAGEGYGVWESETLVWMGDLNYRIDLPRKDVERMVEKKEWELLQRFDQLRIQQQHRLAFSDFEEAPITFPPTFKFDVGTEVYDTSEKQRTPSWTDRILFLSIHERSVQCERYESFPEVGMSDHKPVAAVLRVPVYTVLPEKRNEVQQEVIAELDSYDNNALPDVKLSPGPSVEFDEVRYDEPVTKTIEVVNVGQVMAPWSFVCKPGTTSLTPPWLHLSPTSGLILPNERATVTITIHVTSSSSSALNFPLPSPSPSSTDEEGLSDLLILSIEKKDLFLSVSARQWLPTVFGSNLECLVRLHEPIRSLSVEKRARIAAVAAGVGAGAGGDGEEEVGRVSVPLALHRLVDFLAEHALEVRGLFAVPGESGVVNVVRECLDTGDDFSLDQLPPSPPSLSTAAPLDSPDSSSSDKQHLHDAVSALDQLDHLESDIGSISLSSPPLPLPDSSSLSPPSYPARERSLSLASAASALFAPTIEEEDGGRYAGLHSVADCVLRLLESLEEPVVCFALYERALRAEKREEVFEVVRALPEAHANTLLYIIAFLRVLLGQTEDPVERAARMDRLAVVFSAVLLRPAPSSPPNLVKIDAATVPRRKKQFVLMLLQEDGESDKRGGGGKA